MHSISKFRVENSLTIIQEILEEGELSRSKGRVNSYLFIRSCSFGIFEFEFEKLGLFLIEWFGYILKSDFKSELRKLPSFKVFTIQEIRRNTQQSVSYGEVNDNYSRV